MIKSWPPWIWAEPNSGGFDYMFLKQLQSAEGRPMMEVRTYAETNGHWRAGRWKAFKGHGQVASGVLDSGELELTFHHPDEVRELIEAAEHLLTLMEGDDDGQGT